MASTTMDPYQLPDADTLSKVAQIQVLDQHSTKLPFSDLFSPPQKHLIVFIRHFFCGNCEEYVRALSAQLPPAVLATTTPPTTLTIIGCGAPANVANYKARTGCPFEIYCDPDRALYAALGMVQNLELGPKTPEYIKTGVLGVVVSSFINILGSGPRKGLSGGPFSQNGGEWVWDDGKLVWCHRMRYTRDHAEIKELKEVLGMKEG